MIKGFLNHNPNIDESVFVAQNACIIGNVSVGKDGSIYYNAVLRADNDSITIGEKTNIQDGVIIHVDKGFPVIIGNGCTVGHGAIVHGCTIGDNTVIGMGAIVLNGAQIGRDCIVGAGALVTQNSLIPDGSLVIGSPAKIKRELSEEEIKNNIALAELYSEESKKSYN